MSLQKILGLSLMASSLPAFSGLYAQNAASDDEEVFELSPFSVDGSQDVGYLSTSSLAGTRLSTNMRDIAASVSILNEDFLDDTGSNTIGDALLFTPNTEVSGINGNFSGYQSSAGNAIPETETDRPQGGTSRVRGLAEADLTRNYFNTEVPFDTYNTERVEVQRGANSALFGIGSPGGIVNNTTLRANLYSDFGRVRLETDEHGTRRASFRHNHVIIEDKLAIRVAGLMEDREYEQKEAFLEDERIYAAVTWKINENLRAHASIEAGSRHSANPDQTPPNDGITPWIEMGKPISMGGADGSDLWRSSGDFVPGVANNAFLDLAGPGASSGFVSYFNNTDVAPFFGGNTFIRANRGAPGGDVTGELMLFQPRTREDIIRRSGHYPDGTPVEAGTGGFYIGGFVATQLTDTSIFDYRKHLYTGGAHSQNSDWSVMDAALEGSWFDNQLGFELAMFKQEQFSKSSNPLQGLSQRTIYIDPNMYLNATVDGTPDGALVPNPHFGKPVIGGWWQGNNLSADRDSTRLTGYGEIRFEDFMDESKLSRILGRLKFTGVLQERELRDSESYGRYKIDPNSVVQALQGDTPLSFATIRTGSIFELPHNPNIDYLAITSLDDLKGANIGGVPFGQERDRPVVGGTWTGWSQSAGEYVEFDATTYNMDDGGNYPASFFAGKGLEELESQVVVAQHYLWDNSIVLMGTWRNDKLSSTSISAPGGVGITSEGDRLYDPTFQVGPLAEDLEEDANDDTTSWSATVHLRDMFGGDVPDISLYMTESDNFQPSGGRVNVFNESIAPVTGSTEEQGIIYRSSDGKISARLNKYETGILNNTFDAGGVSASEGILKGLVEQLDNPANTVQGFTAADAQAVLPPQGVIDVNGFVPDWTNFTATTDRNSGDTGTQDFTAKGYELELALNPNERWTTMVTVGKQQTVLSNIYPTLRQYVNDFVIPNWVNSDFAKNYYIDDLGTKTLAEQATDAIVTPVAAALTQEGIPSIEQREWRFNLNTSYGFEAGSGSIPDFLGKFTVGGGYRWQDKAGIGFGISENEFGDMDFDPNKPFYAGSQDFIDLFFRSEYSLKDDRSLAVQLNIKDLFDNDDLVPIYANPDGSMVYRFMRGRLVSLSATYEW
ncbi:TonB-dependent receptor plug domain-containing protein [Pelagicoccus sp. SDUM812005]|uniref:TonB-dependent receptor plug domain-containing protein n=1 Tax=Pelagicoccus sp. SDUM812005 TaxID=3041257 RepID=UPI00280F9533|nr:TonB-dependent receptor plug domain-containing protein [Pelagicoccus sp. SDUM812005]MDQ8183102.1 TonB-dependent receptor plug domain-containing protein [Pelagicoccus sp. SDUM812005]